MTTISINDAASKYGGTTLREVIENMIRSGAFHKIWLYANASGGNRAHTDFLCVSRSDDVQQVTRFLMSRDVANDCRIFYEGKLTAALDSEYFNKPIVSRMPVVTPAQDADTLDSSAKQAELIVPEWYFARSDAKHVNQVVITLSPQAETPPKVGNLVAGGGFMVANWAATALFMPGTTPEAQGPIVFAKASGIIEMLKGHPASVAFAFYRLGRGGIFQTFVQVDTPQIRDKAKNSPFLAEHPRWLDETEDCRLVEALISREKLEVCFVAPGNNGPCTGYFGLQVGLPQALKDILRQEWKDLLSYHQGVSNRNYQAALDQYNRENPIEGTPVLPPPEVESRKAESQTPKVQKHGESSGKRAILSGSQKQALVLVRCDLCGRETSEPEAYCVYSRVVALPAEALSLKAPHTASLKTETFFKAHDFAICRPCHNRKMIYLLISISLAASWVWLVMKSHDALFPLLGLLVVFGFVIGGGQFLPAPRLARRIRRERWAAVSSASPGVKFRIETRTHDPHQMHIQSPLPKVKAKQCGSCKKEVPVSFNVGDRCPHCGILWDSEAVSGFSANK